MTLHRTVIAALAIAAALPGCTRAVPQPVRLQGTSVRLAPAPGSPVRVGPSPGQPVLADFNGDTLVDLAVSVEGRGDQEGRGCVALLLGDGLGGFAAVGEPRAVGGGGVIVAAADVNGDGHTDVLAVEHDRYDVTILLGDGHGGLSEAPGSPLAASQGTRPHTHSLAAHDMNADGAVDILTTNADDNTVSLLLGDGSGGFAPAPGSPFAAGTHPYDGLRCVDVNADGAPDVVVPNLHGHTVSVLLGDGRGGLAMAEGSPWPVGPRPGFLEAGDLDGDALIDLVVTHDDDAMIDVLLGDGRGGFRPAENSPIYLPRTVWGAALVDLNADGASDIVLGSYQGDALVFLSAEGRAAHLAEPAPLAVGEVPGRVVAGDVNGDGKADLVFSHHDAGRVSVWLGE